MTASAQPTAERLTRLQVLTQRYAAFPNEKPGLAMIPGAVLMWVVLFVPTSSLVQSSGYALFVALLWLWLRHVIRVRLYQRHGVVVESMPKDLRKFIFYGSIYVLFISMMVSRVALVGVESPQQAMDHPWLRYLPIIPNAVLCVWLVTQRRVLDALVVLGIGVSAGNASGAQLLEVAHRSWLIPTAFVSAASVFLGISQHIEFKRLERELKALRAQP
jgi:hypothetical protein